MASSRVSLPGSTRHPAGTPVGAVPPDEIVNVSVILKPKVRVRVPETGGEAISRAAFGEKYGADPQDIRQVEALAQQFNLTVIEIAAARRTVRLEGTAANMAKAFSVAFERCDYQGIRYRARRGEIQVPAELAGSIEAVLGLDNRPHVTPKFRVLGPSASTAGSYTPVQVAQLYQFPANADGTGQTIGILELGGGYMPADLQAYFSTLGIKEPKVISVSVDKGTNDPTTADSADGEVLLDIEVTGAVAPGATIVVYFAPNTTSGFQDALTTAIHDATNKPSVISISWGEAESSWTAQAMNAFDSAAQDAAVLGVTICAASGDGGSSDGVTDGKDHVDFPASSPHILACGGTSLQSSNGKISSETVWNDGAQGGATGGGFSTQFPLPTWQSGVPSSSSGRGVPDVSGDADPNSGYQVLVDGQSLVIGGTSAVAPLWSGLIALLNQKLGKPVGFLQPSLYGLPAAAQAFRDITQGSNGLFAAGPGWDACTGLGSPVGKNLLAALGGSGA
ncbi:MAG: S53 family peptidase [Candidatus Sulfopaludibacter sp.]|nr:S53 family peptidase [Candidatus Sulfopaludibacter sp.]